jgi:hypothetical protein
MLYEIHRILKPGGTLVLTTPNAVSLQAIAAVMRGSHPGLFSHYLNPLAATRDARHAREYTPMEVCQLLSDGGFTVERIETGPYGKEAENANWVRKILADQRCTLELRGQCIYAVARKDSIPSNRFPKWLYQS